MILFEWPTKQIKPLEKESILKALRDTSTPKIWATINFDQDRFIYNLIAQYKIYIYFTRQTLNNKLYTLSAVQANIHQIVT